MRRLIVTLALPIAVQAAEMGDISKGQYIAGQVCAACHAADGNSPLAVNPMIAGQHPEYLYKQMRNFKSGERDNAIMTAMVANLSDDDMRNLSAFYSAQQPKGASATDKDLIAEGQRMFRGGIALKGVAACSGCHSPNGAGIPAEFPRLAGQHAEYTASQLRAFRAGQRRNDRNKMMQQVASQLSDREIAALAEYVSALR